MRIEISEIKDYTGHKINNNNRIETIIIKHQTYSTSQEF